MRILLTNDDGIHAEGLAVLERIAGLLSDEVWIVAPETDQSGLSHSLTLSSPLRLRRIAERRFALSGTPTDCVIMAAKHLMPAPPDLVLSGVNAGQNLCDDVTYSGTVAGAIEGTMLGLRAQLASELRDLSGSDRFDFIGQHRGMFSRLGATPDQVARLKSDAAIYMVGDSRLNIAGLNQHTVPVLARAIIDAGI